MNTLSKLCLIGAGISAAVAVPALAQKPGGQKSEAKPAGNPNDLPPGLLIAMQRAFPEVGHGADVPRGKGKGWGHLLHEHEDGPISP